MILINDMPVTDAVQDVQDYLNRVFGEDEAEIMAGATEQSFGDEQTPLPKQRAEFPLGITFSPMESYLLRRGFVPKQMEEKWFIYAKENRIIFRRSWTGCYIYRMMVQQRGDCIYASHALVNRDAEEYPETDIDYDKAMLLYLTSVLLLDRPRPLPMKRGLSEDEQVINAWSAVGNAMTKG